MKRMIILLSALIFLTVTPNLLSAASKDWQFSTSIGIGTGFPVDPTEFNNNWDPSFGGLLDIGVQRSLLEASLSFDYNFFLSNGLDPDDINILAIFLNLKIKPTARASVRPYLLIGGGYYRFWIVNQELTENTTGYQGGAGVEVDISKTQQLFLEGKQVVGRTRDTNNESANTSYIGVRFGLTFLF
jgi:hypothetical protein